jgi:hypothetical protein
MLQVRLLFVACTPTSWTVFSPLVLFAVVAGWVAAGLHQNHLTLKLCLCNRLCGSTAGYAQHCWIVQRRKPPIRLLAQLLLVHGNNAVCVEDAAQSATHIDQ